MIRKAVDTIHRNAQVQTQLIADILDVSRIVAGKLRLDVRPVELPVVIEAALDTLRPAAQAKRVRLETVLDSRRGTRSPATPAGCSRSSGTCSPTRSSSSPRRSGACRCGWRPINSHVRLTVEDNGPGHRPGLPAPRLRALPAGRLVEQPHAPGPGSRAGHRAAPGGAPRRHGSRREPRRRPGRDLHRRAAAPQRRPP